MSLPRYVVNFEELVDGFLAERTQGNTIQEDIKKDIGGQYSKGFYLNLSGNNCIEWKHLNKIFITNIEISTVSSSIFGDTNISLYIENDKTGKKSYIFENVYVKDIHDLKNLFAYPVLDVSDTLKIIVNNHMSGIEDLFIDIDFVLATREDNEEQEY